MGSKRRARSAHLDSQALGTATALLAPAGLGRPINAAHRCSGARHRHACRALAHTLVHRGEGPGCAPAFGPARAPDSSAARPGKRRSSAPLVRAHRHAAPVSDPVGTRTAAARSRPALCLHLPARISSVCSGAASTRIMHAMPQNVPCAGLAARRGRRGPGQLPPARVRSAARRLGPYQRVWHRSVGHGMNRWAPAAATYTSMVMAS